MDPQATLYDLLDAISRNDRDEVDELLEALQEWNLKGGFLPKVQQVQQVKNGFIVYRKP